MQAIRDLASLVWELLRGKKTYLVGLSALVYGLYAGDAEAVLLGLGLLGLRHGIANEVARMVTEKD